MNENQFALLQLQSHQLLTLARKLLVSEESVSIKENLEKEICGLETCTMVETSYPPLTFRFVEAKYRYTLASYMAVVYNESAFTDALNDIAKRSGY